MVGQEITLINGNICRPWAALTHTLDWLIFCRNVSPTSSALAALLTKVWVGPPTHQQVWYKWPSASRQPPHHCWASLVPPTMDEALPLCSRERRITSKYLPLICSTHPNPPLTPLNPLFYQKKISSPLKSKQTVDLEKGLMKIIKNNSKSFQQQKILFDFGV